MIKIDKQKKLIDSQKGKFCRNNNISKVIMRQINTRSSPFNDYDHMSPRTQPQNKTPIESYYFTSQQPKSKKEYGMFSKRYLPKENSSMISRSKVSQNMSTSSNMGLFQQEKLYSEQMLFLLSEEDNNIKYFKEKIDAEKQRVLRDFQNTRKQIEHIFSDLQISFMEYLDIVYKDFMNRYKTFKQHMVNLKEIRRNLINEMPQDQNDYLSHLNQSKVNSISNRDLLNEIEKDAQLFRTQKIYSQITDMQKENIQPAKELAMEIIMMGGIETQYYNEVQTNQLMKKIVDILGKEIKLVYPQISNNYIRSPNLIFTEQMENKNQDILNGLSEYQPNQMEVEDRMNFKSADKAIIKPIFAVGKKPEQRLGENLNEKSYNNTTENKKYTRPISSSSDFQVIGTVSKHSKAVAQRDDDYSGKNGSEWKSARNYHMGNLKNQTNSKFKVGIQQQNLYSEWIQDISLRQVGVVEAYQNSQAMLCGIFACDGKVIVVGGKDRVLRVYQVSTSKLLYVLSGHQANICSLANHGSSLISSGGDHGCSTLIMWQCKNWTIRSKVQLHTAAVTCIVDLQDNSNLATASYDKTISIFNYRKGAVIFTVNSCKSGITCMGLTSDKHRLISSLLDHSIVSWKIARQGTNITNIQLERHFMNENMVVSLKTFALKSNYFIVGSKDGKIQIINCLTGQTIRKLTVGTGTVVQMILFQRENKPQCPIIITCSPKQKTLIITKTESGSNSSIDVKGRLNIEFGGGIGPKIIISQSGLLGIVSQSPMLKQILLYQIGLL